MLPGREVSRSSKKFFFMEDRLHVEEGTTNFVAFCP